MKYILKLLLVLLFITSLVYAQEFKKPDFDPRLRIDSHSVQWYNDSDDDSASAYNIGFLYDTKIKDNKLAEFWYKQALKIDPNNTDSANNLAYIYEDRKEYQLAKKYYLYSAKAHNKYGIYNLAMLYENHDKNYKEAIKWYKKGIERKSLDAMKNLSLLYYKKLHDNVKAVEYFIPLIDKKYSKEKVMNFFKVKYKVDKATIQKGYEAQLKSKIIPEKLKYKGGI